MGVGLTFLIVAVLIAIGVPIAFSVGFASLLNYAIGERSLLIIPQVMTGAVDSFPLLAIPLFMLVGLVMNLSGVTKRIFGFAQSLVGHISGGLAHVNVVASIIFSGMSGSATADAAGLGSVEIKAMTERGFPARFAAAVTAASATIGPIIPPSMPMIIYGTIVGVSIGRLFLAGIIPGLLMGAALMVLIYVASRRQSFPREPRRSFPVIATTFGRSIPPLMTPIIILGGITLGAFTPTEAAGVAALYAFFLGGVIYRELRFRPILDMCNEVAVTTGTVLVMLAAAFLIMRILTLHRVPEAILFPVRKVFRALPGRVSAPRQAEPPRGDRGKFRRRSMGLDRASLLGLLRDIGGIDDLFVLNGPGEDRAVA